MEKEPCLSCKSVNYTRSTWWITKGVRGSTCSECSTQAKVGYTDADGNKITYIPVDGIWPTLGVPISSARQLSEHAKKHGLVQSGIVKGKAS